MKKFLSLVVAFAALTSLLCVNASPDENELTLLFTSDIHSNLLPHTTSMDSKSVVLGGYARLKSAVDANRTDTSLLLDSGDFSMGTLYQAYTKSEALDLRLMDYLGYDAVALGNHDFEPGVEGLREELTVFRATGSTLPILCSNLSENKEVRAPADNPLGDLGVLNYSIIEKNGLRVGIFALMGFEAITCAPEGVFAFSDPVKAARAYVDILRNEEKADIVILLSHCGTLPEANLHEDEELARKVKGIDVILTGHAHRALDTAITVGDTTIVAAGTALNNLGKLTVRRNGGQWEAVSYSLIPLDASFEEDAAVSALIEPYTRRIASEYMSVYGVDADMSVPFAYSDMDFPDGDTMCLELRNYPFASLISESYLAAASAVGQTDNAITIIPVGTVRGGIYKGPVSVMDVYNSLSYGISPLDSSSASPLVLLYANGRELYDICETSVSVSPIMSSAQLLFGGLRFTYSPQRPFLDKVYKVEVYDKTLAEWHSVERDDKLYPIIASWTAAQSISMLDDYTMGLLKVQPKNADGQLYTDNEQLESAILTLPNGREVKEWYALYSYIGTMSERDSLHVIPAAYASVPEYMLSTPASLGNYFTNISPALIMLLSVLLGIVVLTVFIVVLAVRHAKKKRAAKAAHMGDAGVGA